jgi:hypothetical protein
VLLCAALGCDGHAWVLSVLQLVGIQLCYAAQALRCMLSTLSTHGSCCLLQFGTSCQHPRISVLRLSSPAGLQDVDMKDPERSPQRLWEGELEPEGDTEFPGAGAAAAAGGAASGGAGGSSRRQGEHSYR